MICINRQTIPTHKEVEKDKDNGLTGGRLTAVILHHLHVNSEEARSTSGWVHIYITLTF